MLFALITGMPIACAIACGLWFAYWSNTTETPLTSYTPPAYEIQYLEDKSGNLNIENILSLENQFDSLQGTATPNFGFNAAVIWLKLDVAGSCLPESNKIIEVKNPLLDYIALYEDNGDTLRMINEAGDQFYFSARKNNERNYCFPIRVPNERICTYYFRVSSGGEQLLAPIVIWTQQGLSERNNRDQMIRGSYFGLILFILFFNLFIYFIVRELAALYYVYYNLFLLLLQLALGGYGFQYLWPGSPYFANIATPLFASLSVFALTRFSQHFLEIHRHYPKANGWFQITGYVLVANSALCLVPNATCFHVSVLVVNITALLLNFAIVPTAIGVVRKNYAPARIFLAAFLLLVLTVFGFVATNLGILRSVFFADYGLLIGSAAEVILLSLAIVVRFKSFKDEALRNLQNLNALQAEQNVVLELKVEERTAEIQQQKEEILSSIRYAERIQKNVLPSEQEMHALFPQNFVIYLPKDIVSGDFYWIGETLPSSSPSNSVAKKIMATADCTGHGVPGAMVSVLGCNLLRETVLQFPHESPDRMLHRLEDRLLSSMTGTNHQHAGDGMDIGLWSYSAHDRQLQFAGANINAHLYRKGEWTTLKATRRPIGLRDQIPASQFALHQILIEPGDRLYTWSDGFPDMMGGQKGKKLKTSGAMELLQRIAEYPIDQQATAIRQFIDAWKGDHELVDDITIVGVAF